MNISATILRNIVAECFEVSANKVRISGEISPEKVFTSNRCWSERTTIITYSLHGYNTKEGFVNLKGHVGLLRNHTDGVVTGSCGTPIKDIPGSYIFFVVREEIHYPDDRHDEDNITIYKSPELEKWYEIYHPVGGGLNTDLKRGVFEYEQVALIQARSLEGAFGKCQNHNPEYATIGIRSTSIGDIIRLGETCYFIANKGFQEIPETVLSFIDWGNHIPDIDETSHVSWGQ